MTQCILKKINYPASRWQQVTVFITESFIQSIQMAESFRKKQTTPFITH